MITAKVLSAKLAVPYSIVPVKDQPAAFAALNAGQADAVLAVIGQPAAWVKGLSGVRLVPVPFSPPLESIYTSANLLYPNLSVSGVPTVAVQSVLVTRNFKTPDKKERLLAWNTDSVCFSNKPGRRRFVNSTPATRTSPPRVRSDFRRFVNDSIGVHMRNAS
ncbi:hypothetical protein [Deinococcus saxicola]|uniref:hypothetical protein n=1 Tax=Deinococcus saxicola TaxID=249406 RepID=UPI0039EEA438